MNEETVKIIKEYFKNYSKLGICNGFKKFLKKFPIIETELNEHLKINPNWESIRNIVYGICFNFHLKRCKNCNKEMKYSKLCHDFCSTKCSNSFDKIIKQKKETCNKLYGGLGYSSKIIQEKSKQTCLKRYGVEYSAQSNELYEKMKNTNLKRYGVEFTSQLKENREKFKNTCLEKYGVDNVSKVKEIREKIKQTCLKKYGGSAPICSPDIYEKAQNTLKINSIDRISNNESELFKFCKKYFPNTTRSLPNEIISKELDIVIKDLKLAIEFNGSYWHSLRSKNYHLNKTLECNQKGYRLIHIWEDEWNSNKDLIKNKLIDIFEGKEDIDYSKPLDRSWFNNLEGDFEEIPPEIIIRNGFEVENCGYLIKKN